MECKTWMRILDQMFACDDAAILVLQKFMGYTLVDDCRAEKMLILNGPDEEAGQSMVGNVLALIHGDDAVTQIELCAMDPFMLSEMEKAKVNISYRLSNTNQAIAAIKAIVSGDPVVMDRKFENHRTGRLRVKLIVDTNRLYSPMIVPAIARRVLILKTRKIKGMRDPDTWVKLEAEKEAILSWMRDGMGELQAHGF